MTKTETAMHMLSSPHEKTCSCPLFWCQAEQILSFVGHCMELACQQTRKNLYTCRLLMTCRHGDAARQYGTLAHLILTSPHNQDAPQDTSKVLIFQTHWCP